MDQHIDRRRFVSLGLAGAAATALGVTAIGADGSAQAATGAAAPTAEPVLLAADEFDGPAGSAPNPAVWRYDLGAGGWGNAELETYTDSRRNAALDGAGNLVITAQREADGSYTSARLKSEGTSTAQYGRIEARIRIPRGQGIWPAFWMLGANIKSVGWPRCGEIDIMENIGKEPGIVHGTLHGPGYSGEHAFGAPSKLESGAYADDFHVYAVEWEPRQIRWYRDGILYHTATPDKVKGEWVFEHPFYVILNLAVGGYWPGYPDQTTVLPQRMLVDWVRVYKRSSST